MTESDRSAETSRPQRPVPVRLREQIETAEDERLAPWGMRASRSLGRLVAESEHPYRTSFQRDRDRVLHSTAFRRLQYKTQVFVYHEGDHFRSRLTHTLEASQIGRTLARALGANEDLTEAIVLAHDLGHPPFGHSGERALRRLLDSHGGFEHNRQGLRIVDLLEVRTTAHRGLNLTQETRAGILKHGSKFPRYPHPVALPQIGSSPGIEAQIANRADEIAYHNHDIDDGLRSGLLRLGDLEDLRLWRRVRNGDGPSPSAESDPLIRPMISALIHLLATDLVESSARRLRKGDIRSAEAVRARGRPLIGFSTEIEAERREVAAFLSENLYRHHRVVRMSIKAERILGDLWDVYGREPRLLPPHVLGRGDGEPLEREIADYLAGMTDRFAMEEHQRLFDPWARA